MTPRNVTTVSPDTPPQRPRFSTAGGPTSGTTAERDPLLAHYTRYSDQEPGILQQAKSTQVASGWVHRARRHLTQDVTTARANWVLIFCFFLNGMVDAGAYNAYSCFVGMVTGNTIFIALGVSDLPVKSPDWAWTKSLCSILAFFLGTICFSTFHSFFGRRRRWTLTLSFVVQAVLVMLAALMIALRLSSESPAKRPAVIAEVIPKDPGFLWMDLIPIAMLSFQASAKVLTSRYLEYPFLVTVVLTTLYSDLLADPALLTGGLLGNDKRNNRLGGAVFYFVGAVVGGAFAASAVGFEGALWLACGCNLVLAVVLAFWPADDAREEDENTT